MALTTRAPTTAWDPFAEMRRFHADMNRLFGSTPGFLPMQSYPPIGVWLSEDSVVATAELPGLSKDDIELTVQDDTLTIRGERKTDEPENAVWHRRERAAGNFARTIDLPFRVDPEKVDARFQTGVLAVEMQRPESDKPRRIQITAG